MRLSAAFLDLVIIFCILVTPVFIHEVTHKYVYEEAGCSAEIKYVPSFEDRYLMATTGSCPDLDHDELMRVQDRQFMVEAAGYQTMPIFWLVGLAWFGQMRFQHSVERDLKEVELAIYQEE